MIELIAWVIAGTFVIAVLSAVLPFLLFITGAVAAGWIVSKVVNVFNDRWQAIRQDRNDLIARADRQHKMIMDGDEDGGTYGDYPPSW